MQFALVLAIAPLLLGHAAQASQDRPKSDDTRVEVAGCVKGSTLTETNLRVAGTKEESSPARRWRLRGSKALMKHIKEHAGKELEITGTSKNPQSGLVISDRRVGNTRIMIGTTPGGSRPDPLPELPTIDVEAFKPTGEMCP